MKELLKALRKIIILDVIVSFFCSAILVGIGPFIVKLFMKEYNPEIMNAANHYLWAIAECYSLVAILFVFLEIHFKVSVLLMPI